MKLYTSEADRLGYCNPELDGLLAQARSSLESGERLEFYAQANEVVWEDAPDMFPTDLMNNVAYGSQVQAVELPPTNSPIIALSPE